MAEKFKWIVYVDEGMKELRGEMWHHKNHFDEFYRKTDAEEYARNLRKKFKNVVMDAIKLPGPEKFQILNY
ncbi:MAG: hypothetical protein ACRCU6_12230 [Fusobacteriaceae bacterium]